MPIYEYHATCGCVIEMLRRAENRDDAVYCTEHGKLMRRTPSLPAKRTDGIYSYAPNFGRAELSEKGAARERGEKWDTLTNPKPDV